MMLSMGGRTCNIIMLALLACLFFSSCTSFDPSISDSSSVGLLPCSYRGMIVLHADELVIDECTTCTCYNSTVKCNIKSCPPTFCDEPIVDPSICCDLCPYYVPVWKVIPQNVLIIFEKAVNGFAIDLNLKINEQGLGVDGYQLWKVSAWGSANKHGSGDRIGYLEQVLSESQDSIQLRRPPIFGGFEFSIRDIEIVLDGTNATCDQMAYLCVELGMGDDPDLIYPQVPFTVEGVWAETDISSTPQHLIGCSPFLNCIVNTSSINDGHPCTYEHEYETNTVKHDMIDECVSCSCNSGIVNCGETICKPISCDHPVQSQTDCCQLCPYYVPVWRIEMQQSPPIIIENAIDDFEFDLKVKINELGQGVEGKGLWKVSTWVSSNYAGIGRRIGYVEQVLTEGQAATELVRDPTSGGFEFTIPGIQYALDGTNTTCVQMRYMCVEFGKGDAPNIEYSQLPFDVVGVEYKTDNSSRPRSLFTCKRFPDCIVSRPTVTPDEGSGQGLLPCSYRGKMILHGDQLVIDRCTTCSCDDSTVRCSIKSCQPTFCEVPIRDPAECCALCPYYVPVWKVIPQTPGTILADDVNDIVIDLIMEMNDKSVGVEGAGLWKVKMWASANEDGSGEQISFTEQVLTQEQDSTPFAKPPIFGGIQLAITNILYTLDATDATCAQMKYLCARFGKGDAPYPTLPQLSFDVEGVQSESDSTPNPQHLTGCSPFVKCIGNVCPPAKHQNAQYGLLTWPSVAPGEAAFSTETCPQNTSLHGLPIAFRQCKMNDKEIAVWKNAKVLGCSENTKSQLTESDLEAAANKLDHFTQDIKVTDSNDVNAVAWMIQNIASAQYPSTKILSSIAGAVNKLVDSVDPALNSTLDIAPSTSEIVQGLEKQVQMTLAQQNEVGPIKLKIKLVYPSIVVVGEDVRNNTSSSVQFNVFQSTTGNTTFSDATVTQQNNKPGDQTVVSPAATLHIPVGAIPPEQGKVGFLAYKDDFLFRSNRVRLDMLKVDGAVIGTTLVASNLRQPVLITIKSRIDGHPDYAPKCVFWDFLLENGVGDWSDDGCEYVATVDGVIKCRCFHMSTFAVLQDVSHLFPDVDVSVMSLGIKLALSVALIIIGITFLILIGFRQLRESKEYHAISNFCLAVFILYLVFASGIDTVPNSIGCVLVAALLNYFTLVPLLWLAVEIRYAYYDIHLRNETKSLLKAYILSWGLPLAVVGIALAISLDDYRNTANCSVTVSPALFYGAVIPIVLIVLHNIVTFATTLRDLNRPFNIVSEDETNEVDAGNVKCRQVSQRLHASLVVCVVFTLSVCLGYLHLADRKSTAIVFAISVVLTGFITFGMFCFYVEDVRRVIIPKRCQKPDSEMEAPLSFQNTLYPDPSAGEEEGAVEKNDDKN